MQVCPIKFPTTSTDVPAPFPSALDYYEVFEFVTGVSDSGPAGPPLVDMIWVLKLTRIGNIVHLSSLQDMHFVTTTAPTTALWLTEPIPHRFMPIYPSVGSPVFEYFYVHDDVNHVNICISATGPSVFQFSLMRVLGNWFAAPDTHFLYPLNASWVHEPPSGVIPH